MSGREQSAWRRRFNGALEKVSPRDFSLAPKCSRERRGSA